MNLDDRTLVDIKDLELDTMDKWIYSSLNEAAKKVEISMKNYRFNDGASAVYDFFWNDFCDWYVESSKQKLYSDDAKVKDRAISVLLDLLAESMRLMHPYLSFLTEEIYSKLPNVSDQLITSEYPKYTEDRKFEADTTLVNCMQDAVRGVRALRADLQIAIDKKVKVVIKVDKDFVATSFFKEKKDLLMNFMGASSLDIDNLSEIDTSKAVPVAGIGFESFVFVREAIDVDKEIAKLEKDLQKTQKSLDGTLRKLSNEKFINNAAQVAIDKENSKKAEFEEKIEKGKRHIALLKTL
jgi:valyl-tRNA synthetase